MSSQSIFLRFVAKNEEALRRQARRRSSSSDRSRSRSPYKYRPRSRSPHQKLQHIARKRRRSQEKRVSPKYSDRRRFNGNRDRQREINERKPGRSPLRVEEKKDNENERGNEIKKSKSPSSAAVLDAKNDDKREKTEQEIEDELLASSDEEPVKEAKVDDDEELKLTADANDLDFLDDDEEESENEGRFKGKESTAPAKKTGVGSNFKPSFSYDRREKAFSRHDYKRDSRRERRSRTPPRHSSPKSRRKSPEVKKSPEASRKTIKEAAQPSKVIVVNKKDDEAKKVKTVKPLFKSTFNLVEPSTDDKKKGKSSGHFRVNISDDLTSEEVPKKEKSKERIRLVRQSAINRVGK